MSNDVTDFVTPASDFIDLDSDEFKEETLEELSKSELREMAEKHNRELGLDQQSPGYIPVSGTKKKIIDRIFQVKEFQSNPHASKVAVTRDELPRNQVMINPSNFRHKLDYIDPDLVAAIEDNDFQLMDDIVVTPSGIENEEGNEIYRVTSGNRSLASFDRALEKNGMDPTVEMIPVTIRTYQTESNLNKQAQEVLDIGQANELHREHSPVDKMRLFVRLQDLGLTQTQIAQEVYPGEGSAAKKQPLISQILKLRHLPERILELYHFDFHKEHYETLPPDVLEDNDVPFVMDDDGTVHISGIIRANVETMLKLYPRQGSEGFEEEKESINEWLSKKEVIGAAKVLSASQFKAFIAQYGSDTGVVKDPEQFEEPEPTKPSAPSKAEEKPPEPTRPHLAVDYQAVEAAADLITGELELDINWAETLAELLETETPGALGAFKFLYYHGILMDTV